MTTVAALALAAATLARSANVGVVVALAGWCIVVLAAAVDTHNLATAVLQANLTPVYVVGALVGLGVALHATSGRQTGERRWLRL